MYFKKNERKLVRRLEVIIEYKKILSMAKSIQGIFKGKRTNMKEK
jgi:hypothetical protein